MWVYRVVAERGVPLFDQPSRSSAPVGHYQEGEYVRALELREGGGSSWLRLDTNARRARYSSHYRREEWVELMRNGSEEAAALVKVSEADTQNSTLEGEVREEVEGEAAEAPSKANGAATAEANGSGNKIKNTLAGELLDQPFVPRLDDGGGGGAAESSVGAKPAEEEAAAAKPVVDEDGEAFYDAQEEVAPAASAPTQAEEEVDEDKGEEEASVIAEAVTLAEGVGAAFPVGMAVTISGLTGADSKKYNGCNGVVIAPLDKGRQGVRLDEPYASKRLNLKVTSLTGIGAPEDDDDDDDDDEEEEDEDTGALAAALKEGRKNKNLSRHVRTLGLSLADVGLNAADGIDDAASAATAMTGFAMCGDLPSARLDAALRCAMREADGDEAMSGAAELAYAVLDAAIKRGTATELLKKTAETVADVSDASSLQHRPQAAPRFKWRQTLACATVRLAHVRRWRLRLPRARQALRRCRRALVS